MVSFNAPVLKFDQQGEKTGWTYIKIAADVAGQLMPGSRMSFRVKGKLDEHPIKGLSLIPFGGGDFILPLNADLRKKLGKQKGAIIKVQLTHDKTSYQVNSTFLECLQDEPDGLAYFKSLTVSHQNYFSKWIDSAKTEPTKINRIAQAVSALSKRMGYGEMIRANKKEKDLLGG